VASAVRRNALGEQADQVVSGEVLERLSIPHLAKRHIRGPVPAGHSSGVPGAAPLIAEPDLLVLDERHDGVDMHTAEGVLHLLADAQPRQGVTSNGPPTDPEHGGGALPPVICLKAAG